MGGINHQPCNKCIRHATVLSKTFSCAQSELFQANAVLEDALISELYDSLDHARHFGNQIGNHLNLSLGYLDEAISMTRTILGVMAHTPFQNVKALASLDMNVFRQKLLAKGMISEEESTWNLVASTVVDSGFERMFDLFIEQFTELKRQTVELKQSVELAVAAMNRGEKAIDALEQNRFELKTHFARTLIMWNSVTLLFLYSSLISTETHLRSFGFQSLEVA